MIGREIQKEEREKEKERKTRKKVLFSMIQWANDHNNPGLAYGWVLKLEAQTRALMWMVSKSVIWAITCFLPMYTAQETEARHQVQGWNMETLWYKCLNKYFNLTLCSYFKDLFIWSHTHAHAHTNIRFAVLLPKESQWPKMVQVKVKCCKLHLGLQHGWQVSKHLEHFPNVLPESWIQSGALGH